MIATTLELLQGPAQSIALPTIVGNWIGVVIGGLLALVLGAIVIGVICGICIGIYNDWKDRKQARKMRDSMERRELEARRFELQQMSAEQMTRAAALDRKERELLEREKEVK
jgi:uncharacterized membrane protein (DUF106 family)